MNQQIEIVCIGNELLTGKTANTNSEWLVKQVTSVGMQVNRITVIADDIDEIAQTVGQSFHRKPRLIITTGGLGPTFDDKTLQGISKALNLKLTVHKEALRMIKDQYKRKTRTPKPQFPELTPPRIKMATIPQGSKPLMNPVGTAPGIKITHNQTSLIALPGVPEEMKAIFLNSVTPLLKKIADGTIIYDKSIYVNNIMESNLAPLIDQAMHDNPNVYIKSHPSVLKKEIEINFSTTTKSSKTAETRIKETIAQLSKLIKERDGEIRSSKNDQ
ncbi:MAG: molybdopterin-binding protein [Candidatus Bathyarchaeota archaeon]|jgi:molybdenum cofactor synthesis domain-containing protein